MSVPNESLPVLVRDARFRAGRALMESGQAASAVDVFATLLQEARRTYGDDHLDTAPAYYEYGNALFRAAQQQQQQQAKDEDPVLDARAVAAAAAEKRASASQTQDTNEQQKHAANGNDEEASDSGGDNDIDLALEMMETAWSILDQASASSSTSYQEWREEQVPRVLTGIGDVLSSESRHADAADAYLRALEHRQHQLTDIDVEDCRDHAILLEHLRRRRRIVECNVLIAEELLECDPGADVVTTESKTVLVTASDRVEYARGYYDAAREQLQETVLLMGQLAAKSIDIDEEKENVCFAATMVMGVGTTLAAMDEQQQDEPKAKRAKT